MRRTIARRAGWPQQHARRRRRGKSGRGHAPGTYERLGRDNVISFAWASRVRYAVTGPGPYAARRGRGRGREGRRSPPSPRAPVAPRATRGLL